MDFRLNYGLPNRVPFLRHPVSAEAMDFDHLYSNCFHPFVFRRILTNYHCSFSLPIFEQYFNLNCIIMYLQRECVENYLFELYSKHDREHDFDVMLGKAVSYRQLRWICRKYSNAVV